MSKPLVSIITPSFNQGEFIEETILSVLKQDYSNIEYIIIDGASTDNTIDIIKKYSDRLRWVSEKDKGQSDAISKGIKMTKGEIIYWLNSDDVVLPDVISKIVNVFQENPTVKLVYGKSYFIDATGKRIGNAPSQPFNYRSFAIIDYIPQPSAFFKRDAYIAAGGLDLKLSYAMDYDLWLKIAISEHVIFVPCYLSHYRLHDNSKTVDTKQKLLLSIEALQTVLKYYQWAPAGRVYVYCYSVIESFFGEKIPLFRPAIIIITLFYAIIKYFMINKRIVKDDLQYLKLKNIKKIFIKWENINLEY